MLAALAMSSMSASAVDYSYQLEWADDFSGTALNENNWTVGLRDPATGDFVPGGDGDFLLDQVYAGYITPEDSVVGGGTLNLLNQQRTIQGTSPAGTFNYTSGWVMSMHKVYTNKGYFEWRARFPKGDKVWPALWLIAEDLVWGPEWDCFEYFGWRGDVGYDNMGMHLLRDEYPNEKWSSAWISGYDAGYDCEAWHTYGFEWTDTYAKWFIDGVEVRHLNNSFGASWPNEEMYIVMNNGVKTNSPNTNTTWPNTLEIDYVALYKKAPVVQSVITVNNYSFEANGTGKQKGTVPTGWSTNDTTGEGFEPAGASDGVNAALLDVVVNPAGTNTNFGYELYQTLGHNLSLGERVSMKFDTKRSWTETSDIGRVRAILYYMDNGTPVELANTALDMSNSTLRRDVILSTVVTDSNASGKPLRIAFRSESFGETYVTVDNVRVSTDVIQAGQVVYVDDVAASTNDPGDGDHGVAEVVVKNDLGQLVQFASVTGTFSGSYTETITVMTDGSGVARFQTASAVNDPTFTFTVTNITHARMGYDDALNVEDSDSVAPLTIVNHSFEANGAGKQYGTVPSGWSTDAPVGEGFEPAGASDGINAALLNWVTNAAGSNVNRGYELYQDLNHNVNLSEQITITFDTKRTWTETANSGVVRALIYYVDNGTPVELANTAITMSNGTLRLNQALSTTVVDPNAVGKQLRIAFRSESYGDTWVTVDNVRISIQ